MKGFSSFIFDLLFTPVCLRCGLSLDAPDPSPPVSIPADWPSVAECFFRRDFHIEILRCFKVSARILCPDCWLSLEPAFPIPFVSRMEGAGCRGAGSGSVPSRVVGSSGGKTPVRLISPFYTNETLLEIVRFLKYSGGKTAVPALSWWMAESMAAHKCSVTPFIPARPVVIPVPLHPSRQRARGYNQARLLADCLAARLAFEMLPAGLERTRNTMCQAKLSTAERAENVRGAFRLVDRRSIEAKDVILVDDLITSGKTAGACISALRKGHPSSITVLSGGRIEGVNAWPFEKVK